MRILRLAVLPLSLLTCPVAAATMPDADTACAVTFTALSANARAAGFATAPLDQVVRQAVNAHLSQNHRENAAAYQTRLAGAAQSVRSAMSDGRMAFTDVQAKLVNCHARYHDDVRIAAAY